MTLLLIDHSFPVDLDLNQRYDWGKNHRVTSWWVVRVKLLSEASRTENEIKSPKVLRRLFTTQTPVN